MRRGLRWLGRAVLLMLGLGLAILAGAAAYGYHVMSAALPQLEGHRALAGLSAPATVARDAGGVPTITAANRADLARVLGFVHAQERFFQMDLLRRAAAGELAALLGPAALPADREFRVHRFRALADRIVSAMPAADRALLAAYAAGVNAGLSSLRHVPWEYTLLRGSPSPWTEADTVLVVEAMYLDLQFAGPERQIQRAAALATLGPEMTAFLYPVSTAQDAPIDGSVIPEPPVPASPAASPAGVAPAPVPAAIEHGSNNFAVAGRLTATGGAMLENDMHLALRAPNIWYRARMQAAGLDLVGVTLPGVPLLVVGSNGHVAWGFTDSYTETGDAVRIDMLPGEPPRYATPDGPKPIETHRETLCAVHGRCETLLVRDTIWGPIEGEMDGEPVAWRWVAQDPQAVQIGALAGLERARTVAEAMAAAHLGGVPAQNLLVADADGHVGWTIIGLVPRHVGLEAGVPQSWADGTRGWQGYLRPDEVPQIVDPPLGRLWSANARVVGGEALRRLGDGGYVWGARAAKIRDDLMARNRFAEPDLLAIATDDEAAVLDPWQKRMLAAIAAHSGVAEYAAMRAEVENWGGRAAPDSVGYRLVRDFQRAATELIYAGLTRKLADRLGGDVRLPSSAARPAERLLESPPAWVPAPFASWDALTGAALAQVQTKVAATPGGLAHFTWGGVNRVGIRHPLSEAVPGLGLLTDPPDVAVAGDGLVPRVAVPGDGASERLVVSPGNESSGILDMPVGQSDNPLSPYYLDGQRAWVAGSAVPLLPGAARWMLTLTPAG